LDAYGDGWHGGYWEIQDACGASMAGGETAGQVEGAGGEFGFSLPFPDSDCGGSGSPPPPPPAGSGCSQVPMTVHMHTLTWANEITWQVDEGAVFGPFADNSDTMEDLCLPAGEHRFSYYDAYGDGWHGGWWELLDSSGSRFGGGEVDGLVEGAGGESTFTLSGTAEGNGVAQSSAVDVTVQTVAWASEITWNIDGGAVFGPFDDNAVVTETVSVADGLHTMYYFDAYGDGWGAGAYWEITQGGAVIAGGDTAGVVEGAGGETQFCAGDASGCGAIGAQHTITVHLETLTWANEITWSLDDGQLFGCTESTCTPCSQTNQATSGTACAFEDNQNYYEVMSISEGTHTINYFDSYGDGWHGGSWEVYDGSVDGTSATAPIAGGSTANGGAGVVEGSGGEAAFCVGADCSGVPSAAAFLAVVQIHALTWATEITWNLDGGTAFGPYADNSDTYVGLTLGSGDHVLYVFDAYGDGWHGGYWALNDCNNHTMAGGETAGQVEGAGGEFGFALPFDGSDC